MRDFGRSLAELAEKVLYNTPKEGIEEHLKNQFARGIFDDELRPKAMEKTLKMKGQTFSIDQLIEYVVNKEMAKTQANRLTSYGESSSNSEMYQRARKPIRFQPMQNNQQYHLNPYNSGPNFQRPPNNIIVPNNNDAVINVIQGDLKNRQRQKEDLHGIAIFGFSLINYLCAGQAMRGLRRGQK